LAGPLANKESMRVTYASFFLCVAIFLPSVNYTLYFSAVCIVLLFSFALRPPRRQKLYLFILLSGIAFGMALPKIFYSLSISDVKELGKLILALSIIFLCVTHIGLERIKTIITFAVASDLMFSIIQWSNFNSPALSYLQSLMHPTHHIEGSLSLTSVRALGIFSDPAEHAAIILICYLFFLSLLRHQRWPLQSLLGAIFCTLILLVTQSKTGFIAFFATTPIAAYCISRSFPQKYLLLLTSLGIILVALYLPEDLLSKFEQIYYLLEYGIELSSFAERRLIWSQFIAASLLDAPPLLALSGVGRGFLESLGYQSSVFDNDLLYILNTFGLIGILLAASIYCFAVARLAKGKSSVESNWLLLLLLVSPVIGFATDFISSLKVIVLFGLVVSIYTASLSKMPTRNNLGSRRQIQNIRSETVCI
jgi:hypothetical protein